MVQICHMVLKRGKTDFWGSGPEGRHAGGFSFHALTANPPEEEVLRHSHDEAHFVLVLAGGYMSSAVGTSRFRVADGAGRGLSSRCWESYFPGWRYPTGGPSKAMLTVDPCFPQGTEFGTLFSGLGEVIEQCLGGYCKVAFIAYAQGQAACCPFIAQPDDRDARRSLPSSRSGFGNDADTRTGACHLANTLETAKTDTDLQLRTQAGCLIFDMIL